MELMGKLWGEPKILFIGLFTGAGGGKQQHIINKFYILCAKTFPYNRSTNLAGILGKEDYSFSAS
jgi:hypothetical protein